MTRPGPGRCLLALLSLGAACSPPETVLLLRPMSTTCRREPVSALRVSFLGDFPPITMSSSVAGEMSVRRLPLGDARSVAVEGLSAREVVALAWSGPLERFAEGGERVVPLFYGAPDSLCPVWGMRFPRAFHRASYVGDGIVLVTGGLDPDGPTDTLERYLTGAPESARPMPLYEGAALGHSATPLPDGTLLVAGGARPGRGSADGARQRARIYGPDGAPQSGVLLLEGGPRALHGAALLAGGQVLLTGGCSQLSALTPGSAPTCPARAVLSTTVRYDGQGGFVPGPGLVVPRFGHTALALPDGRVLIAGGTQALDQAGVRRNVPALFSEIIDPMAPPSTHGTPAGRAGTAAVLLPGGGVLWAERDMSDPLPGGVLLPEESSLPLRPAVPRADATLTLLPDGSALLAGGVDSTGSLVGPIELFEGGEFRALSSDFPRVGHAAVALPDGTVLLLGGLLADNKPTPLAARFIHTLRIADSTPPRWPLPVWEAAAWLVPRRAENVRFDGTELAISAGEGMAGGRPRELALIAGVTWLGGELRVEASYAEERALGGAALIFSHLSDSDFRYVRLAPGDPIAVLSWQGGALAEIAGCQGEVLARDELLAATMVRLILSGAELALEVAGRERLRCAIEPRRGQVGLSSLGGTARFRHFALSRGR